MISQIGIVILSPLAIWLVSRKEHWSRWGYFIGLAGQPFWIYSAFEGGQWGMMAISIFYTYSWCQGIYNYWIKK